MVLSRVPGGLVRGLKRAATAACAALAALASPAGAAHAAAPPAPELLPVLGARCDSAQFVRIETRRSARLTHHVRLEPDAVVIAGVKRAALVEIGTPPEKRETRIPWAEIESVQLGRSRTAQGFLYGGLVGAGLGGLIVGAYGTDLAENGDRAVLAFAVLVGTGCAVLGTILGAGSPAWTPLYP